jgi:hypothetical protein
MQLHRLLNGLRGEPTVQCVTVVRLVFPRAPKYTEHSKKLETIPIVIIYIDLVGHVYREDIICSICMAFPVETLGVSLFRLIFNSLVVRISVYLVFYSARKPRSRCPLDNEQLSKDEVWTQLHVIAIGSWLILVWVRYFLITSVEEKCWVWLSGVVITRKVVLGWVLLKT